MLPKFLDLIKRKGLDRESSSPSAQALANARGLQAGGRLQEAAAEYQSIIALHPGHWDSLNALGSIALQNGDFDAAIHIYSEAIKFNRHNAVAYYKRANALNASGRWDGALMDYDCALKMDPQYAHAWCNRGSVLESLGRLQDAVQSYDRALALDPTDSLAHFNRASMLKGLKKFDEALASYDAAIASRADYIQAHINRGNLLRELRQFEEAVKSYDKALKLAPDQSSAFLAYHGRGLTLAEMSMFEAALASYDQALQQDSSDYLIHTSRGLALKKLKRWDEALDSFQQALALQEEPAEAHFYRGQVFHEMGCFEDAISSFDKTIELTPEAASPYLAHTSRGFALAALKRFDEALMSFERAVALNGGYIEAHCACGHVLQELGRFEESIACYDNAIALDPDAVSSFSTYCNKAFVLKDLKRLEEALASYDRALELRSDVADVYLNRGGVLQELAYHEAAILSFERAVALQPDFDAAYRGLGFSLLNRGRHEMAVSSFDQAIALQPDLHYVLGFRNYARMQICDWTDTVSYQKQLAKDLLAGKAVSAPFPVLALVDSPRLHRLVAEIWVSNECPPNDRLGAFTARGDSEKIRVGYFSADFRNHPVSLLTAELFETHDRSKFEIFGFAFGPKTQDAVRTRLESAFDHFIDVSEKSDLVVAETARKLKLDIAVDLGGFTESSRPRVFALRTAPIQMSYIGYLGTMGAPYMDYLLADLTIIPSAEQQHYSEKIIYLPSYQVNDSKRASVERSLTREELGLPATGFVYSCFNSNYKITPSTFYSWMRILASVESSCLFLYAGNNVAEQHLRTEASRSGIDPQRIVFGKFLPQADYLARFRAMDLFLDTLPYNAGTTASDALWAGLPVLTLTGRGFAGRVAASVLTALELPELITTTADEYEATAVQFAREPRKLEAIKQKLERNRLATPLFDTPAFTRHLETAYSLVHERQRAGLPLESISIAERPLC